MLDSLLLLNSLSDAIVILGQASRATVWGSDAVWQKINHATRYLNAQAAELLADETEVVTDGA